MPTVPLQHATRQRPRSRAFAEQLVAQACDQRGGCYGAGLAAQPGAQCIDPTCDRQHLKPGERQALITRDAEQVVRCHFVKTGCRLLCPRRSGSQCGLGFGESLFQRGPDTKPQPIACVALVTVAVVIDVCEALRSDVVLDRAARRVEPGAHPEKAIALDAAWHARQPRDARRAQRLQDEGLGLVAAMVREQHQRGAVTLGQTPERGVTLAARPRFDAVAGLRVAAQPSHCERQRQTFGSPARALITAVALPGTGVRTETVVHVQRDHGNAEMTRSDQCGVQQRGGVATAAVGNGHAWQRRRRRHAPPPRMLNGRWCR